MELLLIYVPSFNQRLKMFNFLVKFQLHLCLWRKSFPLETVLCLYRVPMQLMSIILYSQYILSISINYLNSVLNSSNLCIMQINN